MRRRFLTETGHWANPRNSSPHPNHAQELKKSPTGLFLIPVGERRPDIVARLCMVVDWCIDRP